MQKTISMQIPIRNNDGCKQISYLLTQRLQGAHFWFIALNWIIVGWYHIMSIYRPNTMRTSMLRFATTFVRSSI
jgi:hypothetical protein